MSTISGEAAKRLLLSNVTLSTDRTAPLLGISSVALRELIARGECPVRYFRAGRRYRFPAADLALLLGIDLTEGTAA